jgi:hypothetical protein
MEALEMVEIGRMKNPLEGLLKNLRLAVKP